jgi:hypothetical protein
LQSSGKATPPADPDTAEPEKGKAGQALGHRPEFLIAMYEQLMGDINRHIVVVWQMVGVLAASVAALVLAHKEGIPTAYAVLLIVFVSAWVAEHLYDSNYWYNRNLVMITNIERVFLTDADLKYIHPYFAEHRGSNSFLAHLKIQRNYTVALVIGVLLYFTIREVIPSLDTHSKIDWAAVAAYLSAAWFFWKLGALNDTYAGKYLQYLAISPGIKVDSKIDFGTTHGGRRSRWQLWPFSTAVPKSKDQEARHEVNS